MNAFRVCYLLIALLVFQTAVAFYDSHEELQDVATHVPPHHLDGAESVLVSVDLESGVAKTAPHPDGPDFCHHCCHCHGVSVIGIVGQAPRFFDPGSRVLLDANSSSFSSGYYSALFRPPIA
ncbi:hypothetical protein [Microbulbifer rhizosphaerae]|uniref:DUF2946 domain-containing protein n=1 Tax=Microbulbifer rhizosphaerae TaxID=1562603 RepID=A0A7W4Z979_9GAMM|nr:hypothetical protein [Microbulbifer rhizosphaerae]MBB3061316.1 hypothetical protein [Microbulbifer rhizosphaerae]